MTSDRLLSNYNYNLPEELIAQNPVTPRDSSRLFVIDTQNTQYHRRFFQLPDWLNPEDLLVFNNTKVIPARLYGHKSTGTPVEILLLEEQQKNHWLALVKPGKRFKIGTEIIFPSNLTKDNFLTAKVIGKDEKTGGRILEFQSPNNLPLIEILPEFGNIPLPPYITDTQSEESQYQTVFAEKLGAVAAPTAGLHFTEQLLNTLNQKGIQQAFITLHVGVGTFRPVEVDDITSHQMHEEYLEIPPETVAKIAETKARGGRVIAVGTTSVRALEGAFKELNQSRLAPWCGKTNIFIYPGYQWQVIDGLITNFHLPCSSLLMLVSSLIGRQRLLSLYEEAIREKYRFYSFGDAMLILPDARV
jgi:S-adenosylmethionine:tRNA ribosyltransferase-isomerase